MAAAWSDKTERFVEIPGIIDIIWKSDDPDYYVNPIDLFDEQSNGLPDWYGKKDKTTTEQAFFTCKVCECDLKSVVTLRAHCKGTQHVRKALQKKKEYRKALKKEYSESDHSKEEPRMPTLIDQLENASEAVVGLEYVTEYQKKDEGRNDERYYHCCLEYCGDEQGDAESMKRHIFSVRHQQTWLEMKTGDYVRHQTEITQRIAEFNKDTSRDYRGMKVVVNYDMWRKAREGRIVYKDVERKVKNEVKRESEGNEDGGGKRRRDDSHERKYSGRKGYRYNRDDRESSSREERRDRDQDRGSDEGERERYFKSEKNRDEYEREDGDYYTNDGGGSKERNNGYNHNRRISDTEIYRESRVDYTNHCDRKESELNSDRSGKIDYISDREKNFVASDRGISSNSREGRSRKYDYTDTSREGEVDNDVEEVSRRGNFTNWKTQSIKMDTEREDDTQPTTSNRERDNVNTNTQPTTSNANQEDVDRLHRKVANKVMKALNKYYPGADEFKEDQFKISTPEEYTSLAKKFSHRLRTDIKESFVAYNGSLEGIKLTADNEQFILTEVESYFETIEVLRT